MDVVFVFFKYLWKLIASQIPAEKSEFLGLVKSIDQVFGQFASRVCRMSHLAYAFFNESFGSSPDTIDIPDRFDLLG